MEVCPFCKEKSLLVIQREMDIAFFGLVYLFSMSCSKCKVHKSEIECAESHDPSRHTFELSSSDDLSVRVVKSSDAVVKIPGIVTINPGIASFGYVSNVEGIFRRVEKQLVSSYENAEGSSEKKTAKKHLRKIREAIDGIPGLKLIIEDVTGNSAIISDKTKIEKLKVKK